MKNSCKYVVYNIKLRKYRTNIRLSCTFVLYSDIMATENADNRFIGGRQPVPDASWCHWFRKDLYDGQCYPTIK